VWERAEACCFSNITYRDCSSIVLSLVQSLVCMCAVIKAAVCQSSCCVFGDPKQYFALCWLMCLCVSLPAEQCCLSV
jgi:hypothetical protein